MEKTLTNTIAKPIRRAVLVIACGVFLAGATYAQGGPCTVNQIRVRIGTAAQNPLSGGVDNIDVEIHFTNGTIQKVPDVNGHAPWVINSQNVVTIPLNQPVPVTEIKRIRLIYNLSAGEWDMSFLRARAIGSIWNGRIAAWGSDPNPSPHHFTATYPAFGVYTAIASNACNSAHMPVVEGPIRLAPGVAVQNPANGSGPLLTSRPQQGMLAPQSSPALLQGARPANAQATIQRNSSPGVVVPGQTMSAAGNAAGSRALTTQTEPATVEQASQSVQRPSAGNMHIPSTGTISGLVSWDTTKIHLSGSACSGINVYAQAEQQAQTGPFPATTRVGGSWPAIPVPASGSNVVCEYTIRQLPIGMPMSLQVVLQSTFNTTGNAPHSVSSFSQVTLPSGSCSGAPAEQINARLSYCGDGAYNANFSLVPTIVN